MACRHLAFLNEVLSITAQELSSRDPVALTLPILNEVLSITAQECGESSYHVIGFFDSSMKS